MNQGGLHQSLTASTAEDGALEERLATARRHATIVLRIERLWPALQPTLALLGIYCVASLLRIPQHLPDGVRLLLVASWLSLCGWRLHKDIENLAPPTSSEVDRRIEQASGLHNRPLATLTDHPAGTASQSSSTLWQAHQQRILASLGTLRAGWPRLWPQGRTRQIGAWALVAALAGTAGLAGTSAPGRILAGFIPGRDDPDVPFPRVEAWITPPAYAPDAPVFLGNIKTPPQTPQGAHLTAIVTGLASHPTLREQGGMVLHDATRHKLDAHSWKLDVVLEHSGTVRLTGRGRTLAQWPVTVLPDADPSVKWGPNPGSPRKEEWRTLLPYEASHAYGLASLKVELHLAHAKHGPERVLTIPLPLVGHPKSVKGAISPDLSEDPWAGETVIGRVVATSVSGHEGKSASATFRMGARTFHSPIARALLDVRKRFALGQESRQDAASDLEALADAPGPVREHTGMLLALSSVVAMLDDSLTDTATARAGATNLLWDLALDIEDRRNGDDASAQASIDVRAAQAAVAQQLQHMRQDGQQGQQAQQELEDRLKTLQSAISRKMQALANQAMKDHTVIPDLPGFTSAGNQAFSRLMRQLQSDATNGHADEALKRLQDMENATERMRNATPQDMANLAQQMLAQQKMREQAAALHDLASKQTALLDHAQSRLDENLKAQAQKQSDLADDGDGEADYANMPTSELLRRLGLPMPPGSENAPAAPPPPPAQPETPPAMPDPAKAEAQAAARRNERAMQHALEHALDELKDEFKDLTGKTPAAFDEARKSMQDARKALADGDDAAAANAEEKALEALRKTRQQMQDAVKGNGKNSIPSFLPALGSPSDGSSGSDSASDGQNGSGTPSDSSENQEEEDQQGGKRDPLGRKLGEGKDQTEDDSTHIPDNVARQRAREIEQELRRRDSDRTRPQQELDYLDRLLKPF